MTTNPFYNAGTAALYIVSLVLIGYYGGSLLPAEDNVFMPMAALSLFVFSAALMGYLFLYQPIILILSGEQKKGALLFLQTLGIFAGLTATIFVLTLVASLL